MSEGATMEGMSRYPYLAADGGPHLLLPASFASSWSGVSSTSDVMDPKTDYGRACAATTSAQMASIAVGQGHAIVLADPPMTAWGRSEDGLVEVYYLESWTDMDLDALISKASASTPTASMSDSREVIELPDPDVFLLFAGDTPTGVAYDLHRIPLPEGKYRILTGSYSDGKGTLTLYRFQLMD